MCQFIKTFSNWVVKNNDNSIVQSTRGKKALKWSYINDVTNILYCFYPFPLVKAYDSRKFWSRTLDLFYTKIASVFKMTKLIKKRKIPVFFNQVFKFLDLLSSWVPGKLGKKYRMYSRISRPAYKPTPPTIN